MDDGWTRLTLKRRQARSALNTALLGEIAATLTRLAADPACRAVPIRGAEGNFAAGADIAEIESKATAEGAADPRKDHWAAVRAFRDWRKSEFHGS